MTDDVVSIVEMLDDLVSTDIVPIVETPHVEIVESMLHRSSTVDPVRPFRRMALTSLKAPLPKSCPSSIAAKKEFN